MKRSPMPPRRTPLARGTSQLKRSGLNRVGAKAKREQPAIAAFREALRSRSGGMCEVSTPACAPGLHPGHHAHHRAPSDRDRGVHDAERGLWVCGPGHTYLHANPSESYRRGWLLRDGDAHWTEEKAG